MRHLLNRCFDAPPRLRPLLLGLVVTLGSGCGGSAPGTRPEAASPTATSSSPTADSARAAPGGGVNARVVAPSPRQVTAAEHSLAEEATLDAITRIALARNPELAEARARARAAQEIAPAASRLPDPEFEYQLWGQPLARPYALGEAQMHMFGLRQTIPAPGSLGAQSEAAASQANVASQARRAREHELVARVRRAYAAYYRADREYRIHLGHVRLAQQALDVARATYQGGRGTQQDVLRAVVELSRLHNDIAAIDGERRTARGLLNILMARPPEAPLGPPAAVDPAVLQLRLDELQRLMSQRPEIAAAESAIRARQSEIDAARSTGRWPTFMVGVQYMYMPPMEEAHNYGVMFSMSLPWFNPRYGEEVRAAEARLSAERSALSSARDAARYELYEAAQRFQAARESYAIIERDLLPQAQQSFEAAQAVYRGGQSDSLALFDALRALLDVRVERERALFRVETALADVERAVGTSIPTPRKQERK